MGRCTGNALIGCEDDDECGTQQAGECVFGPDAKVPLRAKKNPFSIKDNYWYLINEFLAKRVQQAGSREYPDHLKLPGEFPEAKADKRKQASLNKALADNVAGPRKLLWLWSVDLGKDEAAIYPLASDKAMIGPQALQKEIDRFKKLSHDMEGVRRLLIDTAFFLRISCIYRPCALRLEHILKIAFTDECFPFTNGEYKDDTEDEPRWKKCMDKAKIEIEQ
jgi:hypothetical protein